jgi:hypothetical protein
MDLINCISTLIGVGILYLIGDGISSLMVKNENKITIQLINKKPIIANCLKIGHCRLSRNTFGSDTDVSIQIQNVSIKTIKYITFRIKVYNSVNDIIDNIELKGVGFVHPKQISSFKWDYVVHNNTAYYIKMYDIEIIYNDNSTQHICSDEIVD